MRTRKSIWLLSLSLFLAACGSQAEALEADRQSAAEEKEQLVTALNGIQEQETAIQATFNEDLAADPEMTNFQKESASVFANIDSRQEQLDSAKKALKEFQNLQEELEGYDDEELPREEASALRESIMEINVLLEGYIPAYEEQLQREREIFRSFGEEQADFNTFYAGVTELNEASDANRETLRPLQETLSVFDQQAEQLATRLEEIQED